MNDYFSLCRLPMIDDGRITLQRSSYDRTYENGDFDQFLYTDGDEKVLFDDRGAGCIRSIWAAVVTEESILSFRFGGESTPRYTLSLMSLFNGGVPELSGSAATFEERGHYDAADCRCGNLFYPIPYTDGLKITVTGKTDFYYHIMYEKYTDGRNPTDALRSAASLENAFSGEYNRDASGARTYEKQITVKPGYNTVFTDEAAGVITDFSFITDGGTDISALHADISFDGERISQVSSPLSHLFANPLGFTEVDTLAVSTRADNGREERSLYLPMPYWEGVSICFVNLSDTAVFATLKISVSENTYDRKNTGYFSADYRAGVTELFADWLIADLPGRGNVVGIVQTCHGGAYCEGNEHFYINGCRTPQINGTGTEDLYLACYWPNLKFDSPVAGCVNDVYLMNDGTLKGAYKYPAGYYRFFHDMPVAFSGGIRLAVQHGAVSQTYSDYSSLCISYRKNEGLLAGCDVVNLAVPSSRISHGYDGGTQYDKRSKLISDMKAPLISRTGFFHTESFSFTVSAEPHAAGLILRRLYDSEKSPQCAKVFADGEYIGEWYTPDRGCAEYSFAEDDFYLPKAAVAGKERVKITLVPEGIFTDFEYKVFLIANPD